MCYVRYVLRAPLCAAANLRDRRTQAVVGTVGGTSGAGEPDGSEHEVGVGGSIAAVQVDNPWLTHERFPVSQREDDAVFPWFDPERKTACRVRPAGEPLTTLDVDDLERPAIGRTPTFGPTHRARNRARIRGVQTAVDLPRASATPSRENQEQTDEGPGTSGPARPETIQRIMTSARGGRRSHLPGILQTHCLKAARAKTAARPSDTCKRRGWRPVRNTGRNRRISAL